MPRKKHAWNKRRRESVELSPPRLTSTPPPPPLPTPRRTLWQISPAMALAIKAFLDRCPKEINIDYVFSLYQLVDNGAIPSPNMLLRTEESFKQSWDIALPCPDSYRSLLTLNWSDPSEKEEVERYLNSAEENNYFDVPDPKDRPDEMCRGFFVIYPGQEQKDPIFGREPYLAKVIPLISNLGVGAVEYHNFLTDSNLEFSKFKKANLFFDFDFQIYYITLEATDKLSGKKVTCQSKVSCKVDKQEFRKIKPDPVPIRKTYVESFHRVEEKTD